MPEEEREYIKKRYHLTDIDIDCAQITWSDIYAGCNRAVIPIRSSKGVIVGHTFRRLHQGPGPKSLIRLLSPGMTALAWYPFQYVCRNKELPLLIVEDQFSAMRASAYMNAVSLLGTNLNPSKINDIISAGMPHVVLALDKDAVGKAADYVKLYRDLFPKMTILPLTKDVKDCTEKELDSLFEGVLKS